jgi:hypothetical protein
LLLASASSETELHHGAQATGGNGIFLQDGELLSFAANSRRFDCRATWHECV